MSSVHLNQLDPFNFEDQEKAFKASALQAAAFLQRGFTNPIHQQSRDWDPIVGVSFTGAVTFFVKAFGVDWLRWWQAGRPELWGEDIVWWPLGTTFSQSSADIVTQGEYFKLREQEYLNWWKKVVHTTVWKYCDKHGLKHPNRCTTLKPEGSLTLLSGVGCNGHHMPKGWYYIRRMTFAAHDPIALAAMDYGYTVVPSQSDKDENGKLLNDPFDPRCTEWLVEVPVEEEAVRLFPEIQQIDPGKFSALAQFDFLLQVQNHYVTHNTSATLELTQDEIEPLSERIYEAIQNDEGYISAALLARFEANETFPRLPFEPISKDKYLELKQQVLERRKSEDFDELFKARLLGNESMSADPQDSACGDSFCSISKAKFEEMDAKIN